MEPLLFPVSVREVFGRRTVEGLGDEHPVQPGGPPAPAGTGSPAGRDPRDGRVRRGRAPLLRRARWGQWSSGAARGSSSELCWTPSTSLV